MEVEVYCGFVHYFKPGPLGKKKIKRYAVLYKHSIHGVQRLEIFESQENFEKKDKLRKHAHVINLERCTKVDNDKISEGKKTEYAIIIHFESDEKPQTFSWETVEEMTTWLRCLQSVLFGRKDAIENDYIFEVEIKPNDISEKLHLKGTYLLSVSLDEIELLDRHSRKPIINWPLHLLRNLLDDVEASCFAPLLHCNATILRLKLVSQLYKRLLERISIMSSKMNADRVRYGRDKQEFSLEAGRRCPSGAGMFCFKTDHYNAIFREVEENIKSRARTRTESNSSTSSHVKNALANRPSSPRVPPTTSVYDNPLDAKPAAHDSSGVYSEPIQGLPINQRNKQGKDASKQNGQRKSRSSVTSMSGAPRKPPRKTPSMAGKPPSTADAMYADPIEPDKGNVDPSEEYSHLNIDGVSTSEAEYDSISYSSQWKAPIEDNAYATTANPLPPPPAGDDVYDHVLR